MARGQASKDTITAKLLEVFPGSFINGKEIRIPMSESGEPIQIKITLTAAKDLVECDTSDVAAVASAAVSSTGFPPPVKKVEPIKATAEEKKNVADLLAELGIG